VVLGSAKLAPRHVAANRNEPAVEINIAPLKRLQFPGSHDKLSRQRLMLFLKVLEDLFVWFSG
jgi:hypothetical protein